MARTLLARRCAGAAGAVQREYFWDTGTRQQVHTDLPQGAACTPFALPKGTLVDSWFEGSTKVEVKTVWDGTGRMPSELVELVRTENDPGGGVTPCGLKIDDVRQEYRNGKYILTILASGYSGAVEFSINGFTDVQDSNVFEVAEPGSYTAYARAKR
ncbi:hypothetical protein C8N40_111128 [Pontibacter mucosus]|uniref:Uncharacterized protein n=1 Tax=Pontibacter mucosus TaxID=1649266 RepID=A0A2T5YD98_9BACT|nr:hypothetical protein [Pontibacter mucosus]PTX14463.1 hypothetical protein C8N40_111128 [Pontibacter mucosus]